MSFLVLFLRIPRSCLLLGLYLLSQTHCEAAKPVPELGWAEPRPWVFPKPYPSACLWLVFIPWIRETIFTVAPKERHGSIGATLGISQFVNLSCILKFQWSYWLLRITNQFEVSYVHRLASWSVALKCLGVTPSLSVSVTEHKLVYCQVKWNITGV